jgi:hypothetical protein
MTSKAYVPGEDRFYIVDAKVCPNCGEIKLIYKGCDCEDAFRARLRYKVQSNHDAMISTLSQVDERDRYMQGLIRGEISAFENVLKMLEEK